MHKDIAVFVGDNGETVSLCEKGRIVVYRKEPARWKALREKYFFLDTGLGVKELRRQMGEALLFLEDCKIFVGLSVTGVPYFELEKSGAAIWEFEGKPGEFLDYILEKEEEIQDRNTTGKTIVQLSPEETSPGCYSVSIKEIQEKNAGITSKQALLPFLRRGGFYSLEVRCNHVPPWLEAEMNSGGFTGEVNKTDNDEVIVTIMKKTCCQ